LAGGAALDWKSIVICDIRGHGVDHLDVSVGLAKANNAAILVHGVSLLRK
jgi:hypothetical protein